MQYQPTIHGFLLNSPAISQSQIQSAGTLHESDFFSPRNVTRTDLPVDDHDLVELVNDDLLLGHETLRVFIRPPVDHVTACIKLSPLVIKPCVPQEKQNQLKSYFGF
jgi:hypothetical protein